VAKRRSDRPRLPSAITVGLTSRLCSLLKFDCEPDHIHLLLELPPNHLLAVAVNNFKRVSSRLQRKRHELALAGRTAVARCCGAGATSSEASAEQFWMWCGATYGSNPRAGSGPRRESSTAPQSARVEGLARSDEPIEKLTHKVLAAKIRRSAATHGSPRER
jgi:hypothetical protein